MAIPVLTKLFLTLVMVVGLTMAGEFTLSRLLSKSNTRFAVDMYKELADYVEDEDNIFFSPFSISTVLTMAHKGARGQTKDQMIDALKIRSLGNDVCKAFQQSIETMTNANNNYTLHIANAMFGKEDYPFLAGYVRMLQMHYKAVIDSKDFEAHPEQCRKDINDWVATNTMQKIKNLLAPGTIDQTTVAVLVNAIYFKGLWKDPFDPKDTKKKPFHVSEDEQVDMDMMTITRYFFYRQLPDVKATVIELPYQGEMAMYVILPDEVDGLDRVEEALNMDILRTNQGFIRREINVTMPKFKMAQQANLKEMLQKLGIVDLFDGELADLTGISTQKNLYVSEVAHKAWVDVNEKGTEAAGASGAVISTMSMKPPPMQFMVDRPFLFMIKEKKVDATLFMGRVVKPPGTDSRVGVAMALSGSNSAQITPMLFFSIVLAILLSTLRGIN